jgi:hypothetical protein
VSSGLGIVEGGGEGSGKPDALVELANGEQAGVAGDTRCAHWRVGRGDHSTRSMRMTVLTQNTPDQTSNSPNLEPYS